MTDHDTDIVRRFKGLDTCIVSDALDAIGRRGALSGLVPMWDCGRVVGCARTVKLRRLEAGEKAAAATHLGARAIEAAAPGDVIVVANGGRTDSAGWGGLLSAAASLRGVAGAIVDGACRDVHEGAALGFPLFARAATPVSARGRSVEVAADVVVEIAGVRLAPGDVVVADRNGVVIVERAIALEVAEKAHGYLDRERSMLEDLNNGVPVGEVMDQRYESMLAASPPPGTGDGHEAADGGGM